MKLVFVFIAGLGTLGFAAPHARSLRLESQNIVLGFSRAFSVPEVEEVKEKNGKNFYNFKDKLLRDSRTFYEKLEKKDGIKDELSALLTEDRIETYRLECVSSVITRRFGIQTDEFRRFKMTVRLAPLGSGKPGIKVSEISNTGKHFDAIDGKPLFQEKIMPVYFDGKEQDVVPTLLLKVDPKGFLSPSVTIIPLGEGNDRAFVFDFWTGDIGENSTRTHTEIYCR